MIRDLKDGRSVVTTSFQRTAMSFLRTAMSFRAQRGISRTSLYNCVMGQIPRCTRNDSWCGTRPYDRMRHDGLPNERERRRRPKRT